MDKFLGIFQKLLFLTFYIVLSIRSYAIRDHFWIFIKNKGYRALTIGFCATMIGKDQYYEFQLFVVWGLVIIAILMLI